MSGISVQTLKRPYAMINDHLRTIRESQNPGEVSFALQHLGVHPKDVQAQETMKKKIIEVVDPHVVFIPSSSDPGIFFAYDLNGYSDLEKEQVLLEIKDGLSKKNPCESVEPCAVFKMGAQRAQMELIARKVACLTGLAPYTICGSFFALKRPDLSPWQGDHAVGEVLWNGYMKEFANIQKHPEAHVVGILEPFIKEESNSKQRKKELFAMIVTLALVIGWRDGNPGNKKNGAIIDAEECMPRMLTPSFQGLSSILPEDVCKSDAATSFVAATHLPFLEEDELTHELMNGKDLAKLYSIISQWDIDKIVEEIEKELIQYPDYTCETEEKSQETKIQDDNFCDVTILQDEITYEDRLFDSKTLNGNTKVLDDNQIKAFRLRLEKIQEALMDKKEKMTPGDLVKHVDPFYWRHLELVKKGKEIATRKGSFSSPRDFGKSPNVSASSGQSSVSASPVAKFFSRSFSFPGRGAAPISIMSLNTPGARAEFMEKVIAKLDQ